MLSECQPSVPKCNTVPSTTNNLLASVASSSSTISNSLCSSAPSSLSNQTSLLTFTSSKFTALPTENLPSAPAPNTSTPHRKIDLPLHLLQLGL
ncbi:hypothetical protein TNCV_845301 [Trichonephila clavipes]|uniref:Uncharacterized protein n=1 Tax=Trichonephila clavipes TaxID=2585209 RepID=A0A8X6WHF6_TRICX|nr:hypothetical protein TNCV_845301 [Trichonephila clavipes]